MMDPKIGKLTMNGALLFFPNCLNMNKYIYIPPPPPFKTMQNRIVNENRFVLCYYNFINSFYVLRLFSCINTKLKRQSRKNQ